MLLPRSRTMLADCVKCFFHSVFIPMLRYPGLYLIHHVWVTIVKNSVNATALEQGVVMRRGGTDNRSGRIREFDEGDGTQTDRRGAGPHDDLRR